MDTIASMDEMMENVRVIAARSSGDERSWQEMLSCDEEVVVEDKPKQRRKRIDGRIRNRLRRVLFLWPHKYACARKRPKRTRMLSLQRSTDSCS